MGNDTTTGSFTQGPNEVKAKPPDPVEYKKVADEQDNLKRPYQIPSTYTKDTFDVLGGISECPLIVFINSRSGGQQGSELTLAFNKSLGRAQVFDLSTSKPRDVLTKMWANFDAAEAAGDHAARVYQKRLRILVAGGDGTIAWVMGTLKSLDLTPVPPIAMMPMGTGNDLARTFGWGPGFDADWIKSHKSMFQTLKRIATSKLEHLDCWRLTLSLPRAELLGKLPYSLQRLPSDPASAEATMASGMFWNYFSVGLDAQAAHGFHSLREKKPWLTAGRLTNQAWYSIFSCNTGWFCCTKPLTSRVRNLKVQYLDSLTWVDIAVESHVKALVVLNLQSYAGGRNLWGKDDAPCFAQKAVKLPTYNDKMLEVVGLTSGLHTGMVMATKGSLLHARRICQVSALRMDLQAQYLRSDGIPSHAYLQVDGEPWVQDVPSTRDSQYITVEISHCGTSQVLRNVAGLHATRQAGDSPDVVVAVQDPRDVLREQTLKMQPLVVTAEPVVGMDMIANAEAVTDSPAHMQASLGHSTTSALTLGTEATTNVAMAGSSTITSFSSTMR
ncbi:hypothetical protein CEUSTIGMA_g2920.t1 [Chlamydomonas eustigma]|uniref:Diacylglycerol kinase n=1 Tax=Chlamydomonas eustigma TaxID=1157962 RepID=A0A250WXB8_9CHLO|nr:hypothetical protein CEUSTIGMA_g2920.t1 [Chlamydomonas eustigma]|eukprot:GAX75477.1 hypothetical protein CEUSTIGMA_g2920.t1 [Chlamydomonas eustigma]